MYYKKIGSVALVKIKNSKLDDPRNEELKSSSLPISNSNLSIRMLEILYSRQVSIVSAVSDSYLSLEELTELIRRDPNIPEYSKKRIVLNYALKEIMLAGNGKETPPAYLYPVLSIENKKIQCKIYLMTPIEKNSEEVSRFYESCFQKSLPALEILLSQKYNSPKRINSLDFLYTLIKENRVDERKFSPFEHSIEEEIRTLCRRAFNPYNLISIDAFLHDLLSYGKRNNQILEITPEYHINNTQLSLDTDGNILHESEIYYHYYCHLSSLDRFLREHLTELSRQYTLLTLEKEILDYSSTYSESINLNPTAEIERTRILVEILESIPVSSYNEQDKKIIQSLKSSSKILKRLFYLIPFYTHNRQENLTENCINRLRRSVLKSSSEKKELYTIQLESLLAESKPVSPEQKLVIEREIRKVILEEFGSYEIIGKNGATTFYLLFPQFFTELLLRATELAINSESYREKYKILKSIQKQLHFKHTIIDSELSEERISELQNLLGSLEKKIQTIFTFQKIGIIFFSLFVYAICFGSLSYLVYLKVKMNIPLRLLAGIPLGITGTMFIHWIWKRISTQSQSEGMV